MKRDDVIFDIIEKENQRQRKGIELIASENFVSEQVMQAMGSCLTNKYAEGYPGKRYYGGCEVVDQSEQVAIDRIKKLFNAEWANVQPHSGAQANMAVFMAVLNPGDKFLGLNPQNGTPMFDDWADRWYLLKGKTLAEVIPLVLEDSGTREPKFSGNLNNTFTYKNWSLGLNFAYSLGSKVRLFEMYGPIMDGVSSAANIRKEFLNRWQVPGDETRTNYPSIISPSSEDYTKYSYHYSSSSRAVGVNSGVVAFAENIWQMYDDSNYRVVSGNYVKLQSLSLRYRLSQKALQKLPFDALNLSFSTTNCFTLSAKELKGQDPTQAGFADAGLSVRPTYTFSLNISF